jgi:hypothetical protein
MNPAEQPLGKLTAHSLPSGFVTEAARFGISLGQTMTMTGHKRAIGSGLLPERRAVRLDGGKAVRCDSTEASFKLASDCTFATSAEGPV